MKICLYLLLKYTYISSNIKIQREHKDRKGDENGRKNRKASDRP